MEGCESAVSRVLDCDLIPPEFRKEEVTVPPLHPPSRTVAKHAIVFQLSSQALCWETSLLDHMAQKLTQNRTRFFQILTQDMDTTGVPFGPKNTDKPVLHRHMVLVLPSHQGREDMAGLLNLTDSTGAPQPNGSPAPPLTTNTLLADQGAQPVCFLWFQPRVCPP